MQRPCVGQCYCINVRRFDFMMLHTSAAQTRQKFNPLKVVFLICNAKYFTSQYQHPNMKRLAGIFVARNRSARRNINGNQCKY
jgi:hypothetical protein